MLVMWVIGIMRLLPLMPEYDNYMYWNHNLHGLSCIDLHRLIIKKHNLHGLACINGRKAKIEQINVHPLLMTAMLCFTIATTTQFLDYSTCHGKEKAIIYMNNSVGE
jgi:hypothetical protein